VKILFIGDIVASPGREAIEKLLPGLKQEFNLDFVIANAENVAGGSGITPKVARELFNMGIDVLTAGDHIWKKKEIFEIINDEARILRPANFPSPCVGKGSGIFQTKDGAKLGIISILGRVFMEPMVECPFRTVKAEFDKLITQTKVIIVDVHAEATSEKVALGWYLDGLASAIVGSHTHIQTADERILPRGSAYITDVGMSGPIDSVIGRKIDDVLERFITQMPTRFEIASENIQLQGVVLDIDEASGKANSIIRIQKKISN